MLSLFSLPYFSKSLCFPNLIEAHEANLLQQSCRSVFQPFFLERTLKIIFHVLRNKMFTGQRKYELQSREFICKILFSFLILYIYMSAYNLGKTSEAFFLFLEGYLKFFATSWGFKFLCFHFVISCVTPKYVQWNPGWETPA